MSRMSTLALQIRERRAVCAVLIPFHPTRFYKRRAIGLAIVAAHRAIGRPAFIFPSE